MLRECTAEEDRILKNSQEMELCPPDLHGFANRKGAMPIILGCFVGIGLGALLVLVLPIPPVWLALCWLICIPLFMIAFDRGWQYLGCRRSSRAPLPGEHFSVNGGVVLENTEWGRGEAELLIAEDDLRDEEGRPVRIAYPVLMNASVVTGQRILLAYCDNGAYIPLRLTAENGAMIPPEPPAYLQEVNWQDTPKLPHPAVLQLDRSSRQMNEKETKELARAYSSRTGTKARNWVGVILLGVLYLMLLGLLFIFLVGSGIIEEMAIGITVGVLLLLAWVLLTFFSARGLLRGIDKNMEKLRYRKKVMFSMTYTEGYMDAASTSYLNVYEYVDGELRQVNYPIQGNVLLPKDIPYGRVIHKYSRDPEGKKMPYFAL